MKHTSEKFTGVSCCAEAETVLGGDSTVTRITLDLAGACPGMPMGVVTASDGLSVTITINGAWERDGLLASLASVLAALRTEVRRGE